MTIQGVIKNCPDCEQRGHIVGMVYVFKGLGSRALDGFRMPYGEWRCLICGHSEESPGVD